MRLGAGIKSPQTMEAVATQMLSIYRLYANSDLLSRPI